MQEFQKSAPDSAVLKSFADRLLERSLIPFYKLPHAVELFDSPFIAAGRMRSNASDRRTTSEIDLRIVPVDAAPCLPRLLWSMVKATPRFHFA
jgi:hypothetical protein